MSLRILHVLSSPHLGGAEQVCLSLAGELLSRGCDIRLFLLERGKVSEAAEALNIPMMVSALPNITEAGKAEYRRRAVAALREQVVQFKPDVVHSHVPLTNLLCSRTLPDLHTSWITSVHGSWCQFAYAPSVQSRPYLRPYLLLRHAIGDLVTTRSASRLVAVADYVRRELRSVGIADRKIITVLNGLSPPDSTIPTDVARISLDLPQDALVVGAMGYFAPVKGFDILIRAVARLLPRYSHLHLVIAGGGVMGETRMQRSLEKMIAELCPGGHVRLVGPLDPRAGFLSALDVFVISSLTEGLPLSLIQAMQHGKASVVSSVGGSMEAARPGKEGLVFQSRNIEDLAAKIESLILDSELRNSLGHAASERAATYLTLARCADEYERVYEDVARRLP